MNKNKPTGKTFQTRVVGPVFPWENAVYTNFTLSNGKVYEYIVPIFSIDTKKSA